MSSPAPLRVPRQAAKPTPGSFITLLPPTAGWVGSDICGSSTYHNGNTYFAFIDNDGNVKVGSYNQSTSIVTLSPAVITGLTPDIHATPSVLVRASDKKLVLACMKHVGANAYIAISTNAEDVTAWGAPTDIHTSLGGSAYTYAHLCQLSSESNKIYLFYRDTVGLAGHFAYSTSTDGGMTWAAQTTLFQNSTLACYGATACDDVGRIDFAVTDGNAGNGDTASAYHFYYTGGSFHKTDGTLISSSPPFGPSNVTKIHDGATNGSVIAPDAIIGGSSPIIALEAYDVLGSAHPIKYWYAKYSSGWSDHLIDTSGSNPDPRFTDGGVAIDRIDPSIVYVSRLAGTYVWQLFLYQTSNGGTTWTNSALTSDADLIDSLNLEPICPHNASSSLRCLWLYGPHYSLPAISPTPEPPSAQVRGYPNPIQPF